MLDLIFLQENKGESKDRSALALIAFAIFYAIIFGYLISPTFGQESAREKMSAQNLLLNLKALIKKTF